MTIDEIISALEAAEWPMSISRRADLDCAIHSLLRDPANYQPLTNDRIPDYVGSIDAALTLLGPADWTIEHDEGGYQSTVWTGYEWVRGHSVDSPAIALAIAALKARRP